MCAQNEHTTTQSSTLWAKTSVLQPYRTQNGHTVGPSSTLRQYTTTARSQNNPESSMPSTKCAQTEYTATDQSVTCKTRYLRPALRCACPHSFQTTTSPRPPSGRVLDLVFTSAYARHTPSTRPAPFPPAHPPPCYAAAETMPMRPSVAPLTSMPSPLSRSTIARLDITTVSPAPQPRRYHEKRPKPTK